MAHLVVTIGPWCSVLAAVLLAAMTPSYYKNCPRWLILAIRTSAASYGAMVVLRQIFLRHSAATAELVSAILALISVCVLGVALLYANRISRWAKPG